MTEYEKNLEIGMPPMAALEWLMLEVACEDFLNIRGSSEDKEFLKGFWMEIEHLYKDNLNKLNLLKEEINLVD